MNKGKSSLTSLVACFNLGKVYCKAIWSILILWLASNSFISKESITSEVRSKLQDLLDDLIASLDVNELDANQRIKMLQIALQYTLPKLKQETDEVKDLPLFID